jgi:hypothetical protein
VRESVIVVFAGCIGRFPVGGHAWVDMQYLLGLQELGHDVYYLEDCGLGSWVYNWETEEVTTDLDYPTRYLRDCLEPICLGDRWIYRAGDRSVGMDLTEFIERCSDAGLFIVRASPIDIWRKEYDRPRRRIYIDSDPGFTQFRIHNGDPALCGTVERCHELFTVGQRVGLPDCPIPTVGRHWHRMLPPVSLREWVPAEGLPATHFTTVMQWRSYAEVEYEGIRYGNKNREFAKFIDLPRWSSQPFRIALTGARPEELSAHGWEVTVGWEDSFTPSSYRDLIRGSRAEFGVAKHGYVATRGGWVSDRSACYLGVGRPILVQDTGLGESLPIGEGIVTFDNLPEAVRGVEIVNADYERHRRAAKALADEYFSAPRVLTQLLERAFG